MSLFEDLVEELKEENLLEETVIESRKMGGYALDASAPNPSNFAGGRNKGSQAEASAFQEFDDSFEFGEPGGEEQEYEGDIEEDVDEEDPVEFQNEDAVLPGAVLPGEDESAPVVQRRQEFSSLAQHHTGESGKQYFRRRATEEVKTLQMVDHIITRVEKEQTTMNVVPFDDIRVKQSLHRFLQLGEEANSSEVAEIEFLLLQETENWYSALTLRDKEISVENLRSYCDSAIPSLSTQALLALARFYRNAPYSELVRSKFDLLITKLYTVSSEEGKRELSMPLDALEKDIKELYKEWSSIPLYAEDAEEQELVFGAMGFQDFIEEAKRSHSFDDLMSKDFFTRLNGFKEKANESFFAPHVVAAAIQCNVAVGNRYCELIENEHGGRRPDELKDKYGFLSDSAISEAIRKVFSAHEVEELAKAEAGKKKKRSGAADALFDVEKLGAATSKMARKKSEWYKANKKLVIATVLTILFGGFYYFFSGYLFSSQDSLASGEVQEMDLADSEFGNFIISARITKNTAYAVTNESWKKLAKPAKEDLMKKFLAAGSGKGFSRINFLDSSGKKVGYVSQNELELNE